MRTNSLNIEATPMAPYIDVITEMSEPEKIAVARYIISLITVSGNNAKQNDFQRENEISDDAIIELSEKIKKLPCTPKTQRLLELRRKAAEYIDLTDEKTKYLLGV